MAIMLAGCVSAFRPPSTTSTSRPSFESVAADLKPYYAQKLVWKSCSGGFECTTAIAPMEWSKPGGKRIELALIRHRATGERLGSLLFNPGGPGASGYDFLRDAMDAAVSADLQSRFDIVGFDPRGVNRSTAVQCYRNPDDLTRFLYGVLPGTQGSDEWLAAAGKQYAAFAAACQRSTGPLLGYVDTESAARDLDMMRAALGDRKLNYLGYSYGTLLGATYAGLFPKRTGRLVLDGALDPTTTQEELLLRQAQGFENAFRAYLADCLQRDGCPFRGKTVDQSAELVRQLLAQVQQQPIRNTDGRELGASTLFTAIIYPLYSPQTWSYEDSLFADVRKGSARVAFQLADQYNDRQAGGGYASNSTEAFIAINCLGYPVEKDPAALRAQSQRLVQAAPTFGLQLSYDLSCVNWPYPPTRQPGPIRAAGSAPIVVVGTTGDPATPYRWAQGLAGQLENGRLLTYRGQGHTGYNKGNDCVDTAVDDFFVKGTVPKAGLVCG
ncbi:MAG: alpha/beta fold hydrolase [Micrococcales bacterium]|nr:alpha/beta fold hydrolase [Micrococcales bacterium]